MNNAGSWAASSLADPIDKSLSDHEKLVETNLRGLFDGDPPAEFAATWMKPKQIANQLLDLLREGPQGRSGENIGAWTGTPVELGPPKPPHRAITG